MRVLPARGGIVAVSHLRVAEPGGSVCAELLQQHGHFQIDAPSRDLVVCQIVHDAQRDADLLAGGGDAGELADLLADKVTLPDGVIVAKEEGPRLSLGVKGDAIYQPHSEALLSCALEM